MAHNAAKVALLEAKAAQLDGRFDEADYKFGMAISMFQQPDAEANEDTCVPLADARFAYAGMQLEWGVVLDNSEYCDARLGKAIDELRQAQGTISDKLHNGHRHDISLWHRAGEIDNLLGRVFTARGVVRQQYGQPDALVRSDFEAAALFYRTADQHFRRSYGKFLGIVAQGTFSHDGIINALHAARLECLRGPATLTPHMRVWLGSIARRRIMERFFDPHEVKHTQHMAAQIVPYLTDSVSAAQSVLKHP